MCALNKPAYLGVCCCCLLACLFVCDLKIKFHYFFYLNSSLASIQCGQRTTVTSPLCWVPFTVTRKSWLSRLSSDPHSNNYTSTVDPEILGIRNFTLERDSSKNLRQWCRYEIDEKFWTPENKNPADRSIFSFKTEK